MKLEAHVANKVFELFDRNSPDLLQATSFFTTSHKRTERHTFSINYSDRVGFGGDFEGPLKNDFEQVF